MSFVTGERFAATQVIPGTQTSQRLFACGCGNGGTQNRAESLHHQGLKRCLASRRDVLGLSDDFLR
jgi:hypothetical protein